MDRFVARENIRRFQDLLGATRDPAERGKLERLIEHERERLKAAAEREEASQPKLR